MEQRGTEAAAAITEEEKYFTVISHITVATSVAVYFLFCYVQQIANQVNRLSSITIQVIKIVKMCSSMLFYSTISIQCESVCC